MKGNSAVILTLCVVAIFLGALAWWLYRNCARAAALEVQHFQLRQDAEEMRGRAGGEEGKEREGEGK